VGDTIEAFELISDFVFGLLEQHIPDARLPFPDRAPWYVLMDVALGDILCPGMEFHHEYDFGTTTHPSLRVVSEREGRMASKSIEVLARNDPPLITCEICGEIATLVCAQCIWSDEGWLCDKCAGEHKCGEEILLPVVNSPRAGMCGYTGEAW